LILLLILRLLILLWRCLVSIARVGNVPSDQAPRAGAKQAMVPGKVPSDPAGNGTLYASGSLGFWHG